MNIKPLLLAVVLSLTYTMAYSQTTTQAQAEKAIEKAHMLWNKTKQAGHEWNTIKPLVAQANQALSNSDYAVAVSLAKEAAAQSELALMQAEHEKTNWLFNLPK